MRFRCGASCFRTETSNNAARQTYMRLMRAEAGGNSAAQTYMRPLHYPCTETSNKAAKQTYMRFRCGAGRLRTETSNNAAGQTYMRLMCAEAGSNAAAQTNMWPLIGTVARARAGAEQRSADPGRTNA